MSVTTTLSWLAEVEDSVQRAAILRDVIRPNLALLRRHNVELLIGSDQFRQNSAHEADVLVQLGLFTPLEVLRAWSIDTPRAIFPGRRLGELAIGAEASFLVLAGDPLVDFQNAHRIELRMKQGSIVHLKDPAPLLPPLP